MLHNLVQAKIRAAEVQLKSASAQPDYGITVLKVLSEVLGHDVLYS